MWYTSGFLLGTIYIYSNDFKNSLQYSRASIYADDTNVKISSNGMKRLVDDTDQELLNLSEWMRVNKLSPDPQEKRNLWS